jgi:hypothetical protein
LLRKRVASVLAVAAIGVVGIAGGAQADRPAASAQLVAQASKTCRHGAPASTPGGVKCLAPGEYCSHGPGYARAYREAGFRCNRRGRLERA